MPSDKSEGVWTITAGIREPKRVPNPAYVSAWILARKSLRQVCPLSTLDVPAPRRTISMLTIALLVTQLVSTGSDQPSKATPAAGDYTVVRFENGPVVASHGVAPFVSSGFKPVKTQSVQRVRLMPKPMVKAKPEPRMLDLTPPKPPHALTKPEPNTAPKEESKRPARHKPKSNNTKHKRSDKPVGNARERSGKSHANRHGARLAPISRPRERSGKGRDI